LTSALLLADVIAARKVTKLSTAIVSPVTVTVMVAASATGRIAAGARRQLKSFAMVSMLRTDLMPGGFFMGSSIFCGLRAITLLEMKTTAPG
jgi:hypothetical protein